MPLSSPLLDWDGWTFEPKQWRLTNVSGPVALPNKTLALLSLLLDRAPGLVSKDDILATVWPGTMVEEGNIAFHVAALRKTLDTPGKPSCIETVRGRGYRFVAPVTRRFPAPPAPPAAPLPAVALAPPAPAALRSYESPKTDLASRRDLSPRLVRFEPVAVLVAAIGLVVWAALANLKPQVHDVLVMPARAADLSSIDGVAESIAAQLARQTSIRPRMGTWSAAGENPVDAGTRLQAETILTANVDRTVAPWRVDLQLTRLRDRRRMWHWVFEVSPSAPAPATVIGARAAQGLGEHLDAMTSSAAAAVNPEAVALVLQGREQWRLRTPASIRQAIALHERAIELEPAFARAHAGLADCYNLTTSGLPTALRYERASASVERALAIDPNLAEAHTSRGFLRYKFEWRWREAEASFKRAIELDPSYALAHHWYGEMLGFMGRHDEAIASLRRAQALDPGSLAIQSDLVPPLLRAGRVAEARAIVESAAARDTTWHWVPRRMSEVLAAEGRERESLEEYWRALVLSGASLESIEQQRAAYRRGGLPAVLRLQIAKLEATEAASPGAPLVASDLSRAYSRLGERVTALRWLRTALDRREDAALMMLTHPDYESIRAEPEFRQMLARVGLRG